MITLREKYITNIGLKSDNKNNITKNPGITLPSAPLRTIPEWGIFLRNAKTPYKAIKL